MDSGTNWVEASVEVWAYADSSEVEVTLAFLDSSDSVLDTVAKSASLDEGGYLVYVGGEVPTSTVSTQVTISAANSGTSVVIDSVAYFETENSYEPATVAECNSRASEKTAEKKAACESDGGTFDGGCTGTPDSGYVTGCKFECSTKCISPNGITDPAQVCAAF